MNHCKDIHQNLYGEDERRILGIWDGRIAPPSLGGLLILIEELQIQCYVHQAKIADLAVLHCPGTRIFPQPGFVEKSSSWVADDVRSRVGGIFSALQAVADIEKWFQFESFGELQVFIDQCRESYVVWPHLHERGEVRHEYSHTINVQRFYTGHGFIPQLRCRPDALRRGMEFLKYYISPALPVVVHLNTISHEDPSSLADLEAWYTFFAACRNRFDVSFILIGDDEPGQQFRRLSNVLITRDVGADLGLDLALIPAAFMFMGTASGPCQMALFCDVPYLIYKNPNHHPKDMEREVGYQDHFPFANKFQKFLRVFSTSDQLMSDFSELYRRIPHETWRRKWPALRDPAAS